MEFTSIKWSDGNLDSSEGGLDKFLENKEVEGWEGWRIHIIIYIGSHYSFLVGVAREREWETITLGFPQHLPEECGGKMLGEKGFWFET